VAGPFYQQTPVKGRYPVCTLKGRDYTTDCGRRTREAMKKDPFEDRRRKGPLSFIIPPVLK